VVGLVVALAARQAGVEPAGTAGQPTGAGATGPRPEPRETP
jgi:hypothetical protein